MAVLAELLDGAAGAAVGLAWGLVVAAVLVVILRTQLHLGVLEAALEAIGGRPSRHEVEARGALRRVRAPAGAARPVLQRLRSVGAGDLEATTTPQRRA